MSAFEMENDQVIETEDFVIDGLEHDGAEPVQARITSQHIQDKAGLYPQEDICPSCYSKEGPSTYSKKDLFPAVPMTGLEKPLDNLEISDLQTTEETTETETPDGSELIQNYVQAVIDYTNKLYEQDEDGDSQLHVAIIQENMTHFERIIENTYIQQCLDLQNKTGQTPLHLAVITGQQQATRVLLACGANPTIQDTQGRTPLHIACKEGHLGSVLDLTRPLNSREKRIAQNLKYPVEIHQIPPRQDITNFEGERCIHVAAKQGHTDIIDHLASCGHDINSQELKCGKTVLHLAVESDNKELVQHLLNRSDIDEDVEDFNGHAATLLAHYHPKALSVFNEVFPAQREISRHNFVELIDDEDTNYPLITK